MRAFAIALLASLATIGSASAQRDFNVMEAAERNGRSNDLSGIEDLPSDHSSRCWGANGLSHERAIRSCGRMISERVSRTATATAYFNRAGHYEELGDSQHAQVDFQRALELYTQVMLSERNSARAAYNRGIAHARINEFDLALADYATAAELSPEWDAPARGSGYVQFRRGDYAAALAAFDAAIGMEAEDSSNHAARCEALTAIGSYETADAACAEAVRLAGDEAYPHLATGYLRYMQGRYDDAFAAFDRAVSLDENLAIALYGRGMSAKRLGRQAEGDTDIERARSRSQRAISLYANAGLAP